MTLANTSIVNSYTGTGAVNSYPFTFVAFEQADITITVLSPTGVTYTLILGTDYTVSGLNVSGGPATTGSITLVNSNQAWLTSGFLTTGWILTITRIVSIEQDTSIRNQGDFYQETLENAIDYLTMICQQLQQNISAPVLPSTGVFPGDVTSTGAGNGFIVTDQVTGKTYRILVYNGVLSTQEVT